MKPVRIDHVGIAVRSIDESVSFYRDSLGLELVGIEAVPEENVRIAMFRAGESYLELLEPLTPGGAVGRFLDKHGPGVHHIALGVEDSGLAERDLRKAGADLVYPEPEVIPGKRKVNFIRPRSAGGVLLELVERVEE